MGFRGLLAPIALAVLWIATFARAQIYVADQAAGDSVSVVSRVRVSVKIINDVNGRRPPDGYYHTEDQILTAIEESNAALAAMGADWRLDLTEILDVRGASLWYGPWDCDRKSEMDVYARAEPDRYYFRSNAINFYVVNELIGCGGYCSIPSSGEEIIIINNQVGILNWSLGWLHEVGHYFGLQHTFQCLNRPCNSDHNICTGAGSEVRDCPDACPDTFNLMSGHDDLTPGTTVLSPCQMQELDSAMRAGSGVRSKVVEHVGPVESAPAQCTPSEAPTATGANAMTATPSFTVVGGDARGPLTTTGGMTPSIASGFGGQPTTCEPQTDKTAPSVLRIDPTYHPDAGNVTGIVIRFSEPIDISQVQNGVDIAVVYGGQPLKGNIAWSDNNKMLTWISTTLMEPGQYGIFLTGGDKTDFQDLSGNILVSNTDAYFAVGFALDSRLQLVLPNSSICGAGAAMPGLVMVFVMTGMRRRRVRS